MASNSQTTEQPKGWGGGAAYVIPSGMIVTGYSREGHPIMVSRDQIAVDTLATLRRIEDLLVKLVDQR